METQTIAPSDNHKPTPRAEVAAAELDLLRHLALIGELCDRREQLRSELANIDQLLSQKRPLKADLVQRVQDLGGQLPSWPLD